MKIKYKMGSISWEKKLGISSVLTRSQSVGRYSCFILHTSGSRCYPRTSLVAQSVKEVGVIPIISCKD